MARSVKAKKESSPKTKEEQSTESKMTKKEEFIEQRKEKMEAAREALVTGIKALETDEDWKNFLNRLTKRSRFSPGRLSFGNQMLVYLQFPEATNVATYRSWYRIGRWPIKGSHGIMVFQPRPYMKKVKGEGEENGNGGSDNGAKVTGEDGKTKYKPTGRIFFKAIYLFDISQTEGKEPPEWLKPPPQPRIENKEVFKDSVEKLAELVKQLPESPVTNIEIRDRKKGERQDVHGWYIGDTKTIIVYKTDNRGQMFKTLVHEIAHSLMHHNSDKSSQIKEVEAESVAYVVNKTLGLDTSDYSFKYVAGWSGMKEKADEAIKIIEQSGQRIVKTSNLILDVLMPLAKLSDEDEHSGAPDTTQPIEESTGEPIRRGKGRPKGSKNKQSKEPQPIDITKLSRQSKKQKKSKSINVQEPVSEPAIRCELSPKKNFDQIIELALENNGYVDETNPNIISFSDKYSASIFRIQLTANGYAYTEKTEDGTIIFEITCGTPTVTVSALNEPKPAKPIVKAPKSCKVEEPEFGEPKSGELVRGIDYDAETDMNGELVYLGDYVSFKTYPKGTGRGVVVLSKRAFVELSDGRKVPALAIDSDGTIYGFSGGGVKKLKRQKQTVETKESKPDKTTEPSLPNKQQQEKAWEYLTAALRKFGLPTSNGKYRTAKPYEFMLMNVTPEYYMFKHSDSRNYLGIKRSNGELVTFKSDEPFYHGTYDKIPDPTDSGTEEPKQECGVVESNEPKRGRGRPKGSKNKTKESNQTQEPVQSLPIQFKESKPGLKKESKSEQINEPSYSVVQKPSDGFELGKNDYANGKCRFFIDNKNKITWKLSDLKIEPNNIEEWKKQYRSGYDTAFEEGKKRLAAKRLQHKTEEPKSRKPRSNAYSLKSGTAFELIDDTWNVSMTDDIATSTAKPIKRQELDGSECIIFKDSKNRFWAQTEIIARNRNNKRALKQHMLEAKEKADCVCLGKTSKQAGKTEKDFDKKALSMGVKVELEHTDDIEVAKRIAMDHLTEDKNYYTKLTKAGL